MGSRYSVTLLALALSRLLSFRYFFPLFIEQLMDSTVYVPLLGELEIRRISQVVFFCSIKIHLRKS